MMVCKNFDTAISSLMVAYNMLLQFPSPSTIGEGESDTVESAVLVYTLYE